jgi:DTW domain-containing protein YfiP
VEFHKLPTPAQSIKAVILGQWLSNGYQPINIFPYETKLKTIYIQGGVNDEIALIIYPDGNWRFVS